MDDDNPQAAAETADDLEGGYFYDLEGNVMDSCGNNIPPIHLVGADQSCV